MERLLAIPAAFLLFIGGLLYLTADKSADATAATQGSGIGLDGFMAGIGLPSIIILAVLIILGAMRIASASYTSRHKNGRQFKGPGGGIGD
jgi:hypothetical protein